MADSKMVKYISHGWTDRNENRFVLMGKCKTGTIIKYQWRWLNLTLQEMKVYNGLCLIKIIKENGEG